jgi:hypothetical protein
MGCSENGNASIINASHAQGGNGGSLPKPSSYQGVLWDR